MISLSTNKLNTSLDKILEQDKTDLLIIGHYKNAKLNYNNIDSMIEKSIANALKIEKFDGDIGKKVLIYGSNSISRILFYGLGDKIKCSNEILRVEAANICNYSKSLGIKSFCVDVDSFASNDFDAQALLEGFYIGSYVYKSHRTSNDKNEVESMSMNIISSKISSIKDINFKAESLSLGVSLSRDLGNEPANICTPTYLSEIAKKIADSKNMSAKVYDVSDFEKMKLGSFYGVAKGAKEPAKMIIVNYQGGAKNEPPIALIGKGLTFDTGGISLKPPAKMDEMKFDMCGGAAVLGIMKAVSLLQPKVNIVFGIGSTENMPGSQAMRPGDIVKAYNGKTIEVLNTDAEGRLVLADVLSYVNDKFSPKCMIDFATLTGAVIVALGHRATGIMGNSTEMVKDLQKSSSRTGEKIWELPLWSEYSEDIKSKYADIKNIGSGGAGTITAGSFLKEFVNETPWCHLDIAGTAWGTKATGYNPKFGATGVTVRLIYDYLENSLDN